MKRDQMERLVREELERWDSEGLPDQMSRTSLGSLGSLKPGQSTTRIPTAVSVATFWHNGDHSLTPQAKKKVKV